MMLLLAWTAWASPLAIVAVGDGLVAGVPIDAASSSPGEAVAVPSGWVAVLADCLDERAPGRFAVIDRSVPGETAVTALLRAQEVRDMHPRLVVLGIGSLEFSAPGSDRAAFRADVDTLLRAFRAPEGPEVLVVGMVPPTTAELAAAGRPDQAAADARTAEWNAELALAAAALAGVHHLDLAADWPADATARALLTVDGWRLSDQGHARVAAMVCDAVVGWEPSATNPTPGVAPTR